MDGGAGWRDAHPDAGRLGAFESARGDAAGPQVSPQRPRPAGERDRARRFLCGAGGDAADGADTRGAAAVGAARRAVRVGTESRK